MKLLLAVSTLTLVSATAFAADLPSRRVPAAYAPAPVPVFTWTGFYVGAHVGGEFGSTATASSSLVTGGVLDGVSAKRSGFIGGGYTGYLFSTQSVPLLSALNGLGGGGGVFGLEGDFDGSTGRSSVLLPNAGVLATTRDTIQGSVRGRLGLAFNRTLVYATGGAAFGGLENNYFNSATGTADNASRSRVGYTVGGGIEYALINNFSVRVEYRFTDFGRYTDNLPNTTGGLVNVSQRVTENRVQGGFSYKFETFTPAPVVARY